ncbi:MAG: CPBP family intramembrane glutamic endopeptidase [Pyrinomonadaceae bacterium]
MTSQNKKPKRPWRENKVLALAELAAVLLIFVADWNGVVPYSKTPFLFLLGWASLRFRGMRWRDVGLSLFRNWKATIGFGILGGLFTEPFEWVVTQPLLVRLTGVQPNLEDLRVLTGNLWLTLIVVVLAWVQAGFGEEMVFRGYLMNRVADLGNHQRVAWIVSLILVSTLFAFAHTYQGITGVIENGIAGLILGGMYLMCGRNLSVPIIAHSIGDTVSVILIYFDKYPGM